MADAPGTPQLLRGLLHLFVAALLAGCQGGREMVRRVDAPRDTLTAPAPPPRAVRHTGDSPLAQRSGWDAERREAFIDSVLAHLTLRERAAQLVVPLTFTNLDAEGLAKVRANVRELGVGGYLLSRGSVGEATVLIDSMRVWARVPLLLSADYENGVGLRLEGGTEFPAAMAVGATGDPDLAYRVGAAIGSEARALGVRQVYAPVADVSSDASNPVIDTRSFGEHPSRVATLAEAYMRGMQDAGVIATAKHFPGHGNTSTDSHESLPLIRGSAAELDSVELVPFRRLVDAGVASVMTGHLAVPAIEPDGLRPASLSRRATDSLLRGVCGFGGLVVTDALNMGAVAGGDNGMNTAVEALQAGADVLLLPPDAAAAVDAVVTAVQNGILAEDRLEEAARRVLEYKLWAGAWDKPADSRTREKIMGSTGHTTLAAEIARRAVTCVRDRGVLPLQASDQLLCVAFLPPRLTNRWDPVLERLRGALPRAAFQTLPPGGNRKRDLRQDPVRAILRDAAGKRFILVLLISSGTGAGGSVQYGPLQRELLDSLTAGARSWGAVSFASPYALAAAHAARLLLCTYGADSASVKAGIDVLTGAAQAHGALPVTVPALEAAASAPAGTVLRADRVARAFARVDSTVRAEIRRRAFPGAQLAVLKGGQLIYTHAYGRQTYDSTAAPIDSATLFDCASMTKAVVTTTAAMQLHDAGLLHLDSTVAFYLPTFGRNGKTAVTVRNLLAHNSGLEAYRLFYLIPGITPSALIDSICAAPLTYLTGSRTVYSDLGMIILGEIVAKVSGMPLDVYAGEQIFTPLHMVHSCFRPADTLRPRCAPTEYDTYWRHRLLQGEVHDECAALLGGVAGHAGLFSTASDLALFAALYARGGTTESGERLLRSETIRLFTTRAGSGSSRALGWDTRSVENASSGRYFSMRSFGHTGFTGTSIWLDPDADISVIFLTNRVYPTRDSRLLQQFRPVLHDLVREALSALSADDDFAGRAP